MFTNNHMGGNSILSIYKWGENNFMELEISTNP